MLKIVEALFSIINAIANYLERKQLIDAGRALALKEYAEDQLEKIRAAEKARRDVSNDSDSLRDDPNNRD